MILRRAHAEPQAPGTARLFFALWPDRAARAALARLAREVALHAHGRPPLDERLHLTLAFLGAVDPARLPAIEAAGATAAGAARPFDLALSRIGGTGYGIAWFTPDGVPDELARLHDRLVTELECAGFARERRMFRPHVTLARDCLRPAHRGRLPSIAWNADRLLLMASLPAPGGSHYREVGAWPLGPAQAA